MRVHYTTYMLNILATQPALFLVWALALIVAITIHEFAHAWTAVRLGDPTPKIQGRLTLNPLAHLDPLGTVLLFLVRFGWGKPVQFDPFNLENPRRDAAIISLAGPASNLILATFLSIIFRILVYFALPFPILSQLIPPFIMLNIVLAVFNLIPIHPLDGGKILIGLLPHEEAAEADRFLKQYGIIILIIIILPIFGGESPVFTFLSPIIQFLLRIYLPGVHIV